MITAVTIENFRGIERLRIEGLGRVNLITGQNNCGKTALLEALMTGGLERPWRERSAAIIKTTTPKHPSANSIWIGGAPDLTSSNILLFSELKERCGDETVVEMLGQVDPSIEGLEILTPTRSMPTVFVRFRAGSPMLSLQRMGEGFQRCFEITLMAAVNEQSTVYLDEIENGIHHSTLQAIWQWIAAISAKRDLQVFATTHSEECLKAACAAFSEISDDALRVVRLARREGQTVASVYDRRLIEVAERNGVDLRG